MIWVETEDGNLVNMDKVAFVYYESTADNEYSVVALSGDETYYLSHHETEYDAKKVISRLGRAIDNLNPIEGASHVIKMAALV